MRIRSVAVASLSTALVLGTVVPASAQDDPYQLLTEAVTTTAAATSFHLVVEGSGTLNMGEAMNNVPLTIDGTRAEGDISVNPPAISLTFEVPLQGLPVSGGLIVPGDGNAYVKLALPLGSVDDLWHVIAIGELDVPSTLASPPPAADLAVSSRPSSTPPAWSSPTRVRPAALRAPAPGSTWRSLRPRSRATWVPSVG